MSDLAEDLALTGFFWFVVLLALGAVTAPIAMWWSVRSEKRKHRSNLAEDSSGATAARRQSAERQLQPSTRFTSRQLRAWQPIALILMAPVSAILIWFGWQTVILPLFAATIIAYRWHFDLLRAGIRWASIYSVAFWMLPHLAIASVILLFGDRFQWDGNPWSQPDWVWEVAHGQVITQKTLILAFTTVWSIVALVVAIALTRSEQPPINPLMVAATGTVSVAWFWFITPWGIPLSTFAIVLLGHAVSRQNRVRTGAIEVAGSELTPAQGTRRVLPMVGTALVVALTSSAVISGAMWIISDFNRLNDAEFGGVPLMLSLVLGIALIPTMLRATARGQLPEYGALLAGLSWIPVLFMVYGFSNVELYVEDSLHAWTYWHVARVAVAATVVLAVMY